MSALTIVQAALARIGLPAATAAVGSSDANASKMLALVQQEGAELARAHPWQALVKEQLFTSTATEAQASAIPDDFDRMLPETFYNRTQRRVVLGPLNPREWQDLKSRAATVVYDAFRQRGNSILIVPTPTAGHEYAFEYVSKYWATSADGLTEKPQFDGDDNATLLDEELLTLGAVWRWLASRGLDYAEPFRTYQAQVKLAMSRDGGKRTINMAKGSVTRYKPGIFVPDSDWNIS